jgi:hypothetical protein
MCEPATLLIAATAVTAMSTGYAAMQSSAMSTYEARVADRNAKLESEAAFNANENTRAEALAHYRRVAQLKGEQRVAQAANGISVDFGSASDVLADTDMMAREDAGRIYDQGFETVRGFDINATNYRDQAKAARSEARGALVKGALDVGATVLGGAAQYRTLQTKMGMGSGTGKRKIGAGATGGSPRPYSSSGFSMGRASVGRVPR